MTDQRRAVTRLRGALGPLGLAAACGMLLWGGQAGSLARDGAEAPPTRSTRRLKGAAEADRASAVDAQFNTIFENQQAILSRFDQAMEELQIIKIRATR